MTHKYLFFTPHPATSHVINNIMVSHTITNDYQTNLSFPFPPLPEHSILFYPYDRPKVENPISRHIHSLYACTVSGPQIGRTILSLGHNHLMIKIGFQPGALSRLLGQPMHRMLQKDYDGEEVFGSEVKNVVDLFANATDFTTMKNIADNFILTLLGKIKKPVALDYFIPEIIRSGGMIKIDTLVKKSCMSNRHFERVFKDRMGVSPKFYSRLVRFDKAWLLKEDNPGLTWTEIAYECNYFDQMHLIRDFKEFANANPTDISDAFKSQPFLLKKGIFH
jgi:AraC-like DNA-binding protein